MLRPNLLGLCASLGLVTAHKTARCCAYDPVVASVVASDASDYGALEAAPR
jgi:hypothetical protein